MSDWIIDTLFPKIIMPLLLLFLLLLFALIPFIIYHEGKRVTECEAKGGVYAHRLEICLIGEQYIKLEE
jgi:hypothetical protein